MKGRNRNVIWQLKQAKGNRKTLKGDGEASECNEKTYKLPSSLGITKMQQKCVKRQWECVRLRRKNVEMRQKVLN